MNQQNLLASSLKFAATHLIRGIGLGVGFGATVVVLVSLISSIVVFIVPRIYQLMGS